MQIVDLERENSTSGRRGKDKSSSEPADLNHSSLEYGIARISGFYAALAGAILRGGEGLSDRRAERRFRRAASRKPGPAIQATDR